MCAVLVLLLVAAPASASETPIRVGPGNRVPACVTPDRLMAFIATRNQSLLPKFRDIAALYRAHGEMWGVRWDYAFFQMIVETNYLTYLTGSGKRGDVDPAQNNFAGIGTTGGGVPGDSFKDVSAGVLAQIQHLVVYSGERVPVPIANRTQLKQDDILLASAPVARARAVTFQDLSGRWAADRKYGRTIESIAERYRGLYCTGPQPPEPPPTRTAALAHANAPIPPAPMRATPPVATPQRLATASPVPPLPPAPREAQRVAVPPPQPLRCKVMTASYGGRKTLLIRSIAAGEERFTALQVLDGFERAMADGFINTHAPGGQPLGEFANQDLALARAFELCPAARAG